MKSVTLPLLNKRYAKHRISLLFVCAMSAMGSLYALGTPAGTAIKNHVIVSYQVGSDPNVVYVERAAHTFIVSELISSNVSALEPQGIGTSTPATNAVLSFQLTNTGNGNESFLLTTRDGLPEQFTPEVRGLWIESNGQPSWQQDDTVYLPSEGVPLAADESVVIYVVSNIPPELNDESRSDVALISTSGTRDASGKLIGGSLKGLGDGGIEAVVAQDYARHEDTSHYTVSTVKLDVDKTILSIKDPYGTALSMPGSEVTYKIRLVASGSGVASNLSINDAVPESMRYKKHSLTFNGNALSDNADDDIGRFDVAHNVAYFTPGTLVAPAVHEYTLTYIID